MKPKRIVRYHQAYQHTHYRSLKGKMRRRKGQKEYLKNSSQNPSENYQ